MIPCFGVIFLLIQKAFDYLVHSASSTLKRLYLGKEWSAMGIGILIYVVSRSYNWLIGDRAGSMLAVIREI